MPGVGDEAAVEIGLSSKTGLTTIGSELSSRLDEWVCSSGITVDKGDVNSGNGSSS